MVVGDTEDFLRGRPVSLTNLYKEEHRTHDEYQFRIKDKVRSGAPARQAAPLPLRSRARRPPRAYLPACIAGAP